MTFDDYISLTNIVKLEIDIRPNSTIAIKDAFAFVKKRVNTVSDNHDIDCKALLTDNRDNRQYMIYSDYMYNKYDMESDIVELNIRKLTTVTPLEIKAVNHNPDIERHTYNVTVNSSSDTVLVTDNGNAL